MPSTGQAEQQAGLDILPSLPQGEQRDPQVAEHRERPDTERSPVRQDAGYHPEVDQAAPPLDPERDRPSPDEGLRHPLVLGDPRQRLAADRDDPVPRPEPGSFPGKAESHRSHPDTVRAVLRHEAHPSRRGAGGLQALQDQEAHHPSDEDPAQGDATEAIGTH